MSRAAGSTPVAPSRAQLQAQAQRRRVILYASLAIVAAAILVGVVIATRGPNASSDAPALAKIVAGQKAPEFTVSTTNGPFDLAHNGGKPTLLEVFATWCPHCQHETVAMNDLWKRFGSKANIVAISGSQYGMDELSPENQNDVVSFMTQYKVRYPVAYDAALGVAKSYLQGGFPTIVLIGKDNTILGIRDGEVPGADLVKGIDAALAGKKVDPKLGQAAGAG
jgi:peroxiredoxin